MMTENAYTEDTMYLQLDNMYKLTRYATAIIFTVLDRWLIQLSIKWLQFSQRVSIASYAKGCISYDRFCLKVCPSDPVRPSVTVRYHAKTTPGIRSCGLYGRIAPRLYSFLTVNFSAKFQSENRERGRRMRARKSPYLRNGAR